MHLSLLHHASLAGIVHHSYTRQIAGWHNCQIHLQVRRAIWEVKISEIAQLLCWTPQTIKCGILTWVTRVSNEMQCGTASCPLKQAPCHKLIDLTETFIRLASYIYMGVFMFNSNAVSQPGCKLAWTVETYCYNCLQAILRSHTAKEFWPALAE